MTDTPSLMFQETAEAAEAVDRLFAHEAKTFAELGRVIAERGPAVVSMSARGSSDHAASFFKYLFYSRSIFYKFTISF